MLSDSNLRSTPTAGPLGRSAQRGLRRLQKHSPAQPHTPQVLERMWVLERMHGHPQQGSTASWLARAAQCRRSTAGSRAPHSRWVRLLRSPLSTLLAVATLLAQSPMTWRHMHSCCRRPPAGLRCHAAVPLFPPARWGYLRLGGAAAELWSQ